MEQRNMNLAKFAIMAEGEGGQLVGGFSATLTMASGLAAEEPKSNNCNGGNCVKGCGTTVTNKIICLVKE